MRCRRILCHDRDAIGIKWSQVAGGLFLYGFFYLGRRACRQARMFLSSTALKCAIAVGECTVVVYTKSPLRRSFSSASVRCAFGSGCSIAPGRSGSCCNQPLLHPGACAPCAHSCQKTGSFACGSGASTTQAFRTIRRERSGARDDPLAAASAMARRLHSSRLFFVAPGSPKKA